MVMMLMTTRSSMRVKAVRAEGLGFMMGCR
jgi:hypothetical protein